MNVLDFIPIYGTVRAIDRSYHDDLSLSEQVFLGLQVGFTTFATTVVAGETLGFTRGAVSLAQFGVSSGLRAVPIVGAAALTYSVLRLIPPSQPDSYLYEQRMQIASNLFRDQH